MATNTAYIPAEYNTGIVRGDTFSEQFTFMDGTEPLDLTLANVRVQIKTQLYGELAGFTEGDGLLVNGENNNVVNWVIDAETTAGFEPDTYIWDMEIAYAGNVRTYISGTFNVIRDYTI